MRRSGAWGKTTTRSIWPAGKGQDKEEVRCRLEQRLEAVEQLAAAAGLSARASGALQKVHRQVPGLVAAVAFFWIRAEAGALARFGAGTWQWAQRLLAGEYVRRVAGQSKGAARRQELRALAQRCQTEARALAGVGTCGRVGGSGALVSGSGGLVCAFEFGGGGEERSVGLAVS